MFFGDFLWLSVYACDVYVGFSFYVKIAWTISTMDQEFNKRVQMWMIILLRGYIVVTFLLGDIEVTINAIYTCG